MYNRPKLRVLRGETKKSETTMRTKNTKNGFQFSHMINKASGRRRRRPMTDGKRPMTIDP